MDDLPPHGTTSQQVDDLPPHSTTSQYHLTVHTIIIPISKYNYNNNNNKDDNDGEEVDVEGNTDLHLRW